MRNTQPTTRSRRLHREISNTDFERILRNAAQLTIIVTGATIVLVALHLRSWGRQ